MLTRLPALDAAHRKAFKGQFTDSDCTALGAQTKSAAVRAGALAWAAEAAPALTSSATATEIDYGPERLTWLVELIVALDAARSESGRSGATQSTVRTMRDVAREKALEVRKRLASKLARVVKGDAIGTTALAGAGAAPTNEELAGSLTALAALVDTVTKSSDPSVRILASIARATPGDAGLARAAANSLGVATDDVALGGRAHGDRDTAAVNLVEGRVLFELLFLRDAFDSARERGVAAPPLIPATGLRHILARSHAKKAAAAPPPVAAASKSAS